MDYSKCAFPKPVTKKKKKPCNGWKNKQNRVCEVTGAYGAERHEIFGASNREKSIVLGLQVDLCHGEHERVTNPRNEDDDARVQKLKERGQREYEAALIKDGCTDVQARKTFILEFGRNYLDLLGKEGY